METITHVPPNDGIIVRYRRGDMELIERQGASAILRYVDNSYFYLKNLVTPSALRGKGSATRLLRFAQKVSDYNGIPIELAPVAADGQTDQAWLWRWYLGRGFTQSSKYRILEYIPKRPVILDLLDVDGRWSTVISLLLKWVSSRILRLKLRMVCWPRTAQPKGKSR